MTREDRLQLKPYRAASEHIDGAWWPSSTNLGTELPELVASVSDRLGRIVVIGYHRQGWDSTPPRLTIAGHDIELLGFSSDQPATVMLIGEQGHHLSLHVIRPDTGRDEALEVLAAAGTPAEPESADRATTARSVADVADTLAKHEGRGDQERTAEIKQWCEEAAQHFAAAPIQTFVPVLVEHIVRNRMRTSRLSA